MRVDKEGAIVVYDSDSESEGSDASDVVSSPRRRPAPTSKPPASKRVKLATGRPSPAVAPKSVARRSSAIQASAVTSALVALADEESSSESSDGSRYLSYGREQKPRGRTKRGAAAARRRQTTKPAATTKGRGTSMWPEYAKRRGLPTSSVQSNQDEGSSDSASGRMHRTSGVRRRINAVADEDGGESDSSAEEVKYEPDNDSADEFDLRRSLPTGKPKHRPSKTAAVKNKAPPARPPTKRPLSPSASQSRQQAKPVKPAATKPPISSTISSYARRQGERLSEVMSLSELQAQERALARFHAQKKRAETEAAAVGGVSSAKPARRVEPPHARKIAPSHTSSGPNSRSSSVASTATSSAHSTGASSQARPKSRSKVAAKKSATSLANPPAELLVHSSLRSSAPTSATRHLHSAGTSSGITASAISTPVNKYVDPVVHSTSWRGVYFARAPSNLLTEVPIEPYSTDLDRPLSAYDPTGAIVDMCALVEASEGQQSPPSTDGSPASTDDVSVSSEAVPSRPQEEVEGEVRVALATERELIELCHKQRVRHIMHTTRAHVTAYLAGIRRVRGDPFQPFMRSNLASHQLSLNLSPIERTTAKRAFNSAAPQEKLNSLVGSICYYIQVGEPRQPAPVSSSTDTPPALINTERVEYPETVIHLTSNLTPLRRASTYIGVRKSVFIEDDPVLRYVPYFGEQAQMSIDPKRYSATTLDKQKRVTILGQHSVAPDLKFIEPSARDHEVTECLLRAVVRRCGRNDQVFAALTSVTEESSRAEAAREQRPIDGNADGEATATDWLSAFRFVQPKQDYKEIVEWVTSERRAKERSAEIRTIAMQQGLNADVSVSAKYLDKFSRLCWYLQDTELTPMTLARRLTPPVTTLESNFARFPQSAGLRDTREYEDAKEWYRDLFCRRCFTYDCEEHGIQQPGPLHRVDPMLPVVHAPGVNLSSKQETKMEEVIDGAEDVIELDDSSNSSDEASDSNGRDKSLTDDKVQLQEEQKDKEGDGEKGDDAEDEDDVAPRRSVRSQTRICSMASASLQVQEQMVERKRRKQLRDQRRRLERLLRANDDSEYIDDSFRLEVDAVVARLQPSVAGPCSAACWKTRGKAAVAATDTGEDILSAVDEMLLSKLSRSLDKTEERDACLLATLVNRPELTCARVARFLAQRAAHTVEQRAASNPVDLSSRKSRDQRLKHKHDKRRRSSLPGSGHSNRNGKRASTSSTVSQLNREKEHRYIPCSHSGPCLPNESGTDEDGTGCACVERDHKCDRACACPRDCPQRFHGCRCAPGGCRTKACACFNASRECDPDYCFSCGASVAAVFAFQSKQPPANATVCGNVHLLRGRAQKKVGVAFSETHGWGAFALEPIRKGEFVYEYVGGIVSDDEAERRGSIYEMLAVSYLFDVNAEQVVDAMRQGNKIKFANHRAAADGANCETKISTVNGEHRIALFARQDIEVGGELFFDYGYTHDTAPDWSQHGMRNPHRWGDHEEEEEDLDDDWRRELGVRLE